MPQVLRYTETWEVDLNDWDVYTANGPVTVELSSTQVIAGTKSLRFATGDVFSRANLVAKTTSALPQPSTHGKLVQLIRLVDAGGGRLVGLSCMQSARNITATGFHYMARSSEAGAAIQVVLDRVDNGGLIGNRVNLGAANFTWTTGVDYALELEWDASDVAGLGGVQLYVRAGLAAALPTLTTYITYLDTSLAKLTTTLGQGPIFATPAFPTSVDVRYDNLQIYQSFPLGIPRPLFDAGVLR